VSETKSEPANITPQILLISVAAGQSSLRIVAVTGPEAPIIAVAVHLSHLNALAAVAATFLVNLLAAETLVPRPHAHPQPPAPRGREGNAAES
jgi:hypothetical protein